MPNHLYRDRMGEWQWGGFYGASAPIRHAAAGTGGGLSVGGGSHPGLHEFALQEEAEEPEVVENGQASELELAEA